MKPAFLYALPVALVLTVSSSTSAQTTKAEAQPAAQTQTSQTIKLKVGGINCSGDIKDIQKAVSKMDGVTSCKPLGKPSPNSVFEISFNPAIVSEKDIRKVVEDTPGCDNPNEKPYKVKG